MSSIGKKIRLAFSGKKPEIVETIRFSEVKSYIEKLRNSEKVTKKYTLLIKKYEEFMEKLDTVKKELEILQKNGEKKFTKIANENLKEIKSLDEFNSSTLRKFYVDTARVINRMMKVPAGIQRKTLNYKNGRETIGALNSFLKSFRNLERAFSVIMEEDSVAKYCEDALKKHKEMEDSFRKKGELQSSIELLKKEKEIQKRSLDESTANLEAAQSKIDNEEFLDAKKRVVALDGNIEEIVSDLKINLRKGRRPISKILHSKDRKLFEFYQYFVDYPLENINQKFWKMIAILEKENIGLGTKERKKIDNFLNFARKNLNVMIKEYEDAKAKKKKLEENLKKISSRNEKTLRNFKLQKEIAQNNFTRTSGKLDEMERARNRLKKDIKKNTGVLEKMLSKIADNDVKIGFD